MFTTVASFHDPIEAHIACGRLRAEGIAAHVADADMGLVNWEWRLTLGGTRVLVDEIDAEHARRVLRELDAGGYALDDDDTPGDAGLHSPDRESWSSRLAWVALMLFNIPLPWRRPPPRDDAAVREM